MEIKVHIDVHVHVDNPGDLQSAIDRIMKLSAEERAKTEKLTAAVDAAKPETQKG